MKSPANRDPEQTQLLPKKLRSHWRRAKQSLGSHNGSSKERIIWDTDLVKVAVALGMSVQELQAELELAKLVLDPENEIVAPQIDLGFAGGDYQLSVVVHTTSNRARDFVCGKVFVEGNMPDFREENDGSAKALLLMQGHVVFETPAGYLTSTSQINDGLIHEVVVNFDSKRQRLSLSIDGMEESELWVGENMRNDHKKTTWLSAVLVDEDWVEAAHIKPYQSNTFVGRLDKLKYNGKTVIVPKNDQKPQALKRFTLAREELSRAGGPPSSDAWSFNGVLKRIYSTLPSHFAAEGKMEYFSITNMQWVAGTVFSFYLVKREDGFSEHRCNLLLASGRERLGVPVPLLRPVLQPGEPCSVYSVDRGVWVDAVAARLQQDNSAMWGYRVYHLSQLNKYHAYRAMGDGHERLMMMMCPVRRAHATLMRRRFSVGSRVLVFKESSSRWVTAKVVKVSQVDVSECLGKAAGRLNLLARARRREDLPELPIVIVPAPRIKGDEESVADTSTLGTCTMGRATVKLSGGSLDTPRHMGSLGQQQQQHGGGSGGGGGDASPVTTLLSSAAACKSPRSFSDMAETDEKSAIPLWEIATVREESMQWLDEDGEGYDSNINIGNNNDDDDDNGQDENYSDVHGARGEGLDLLTQWQHQWQCPNATYEVETFKMRMLPDDWGRDSNLPPEQEELEMVKSLTRTAGQVACPEPPVITPRTLPTKRWDSTDHAACRERGNGIWRRRFTQLSDTDSWLHPDIEESCHNEPSPFSAERDAALQEILNITLPTSDIYSEGVPVYLTEGPWDEDDNVRI
eukprot:CAMPEP_0206534536 /NCGR_PEP_ID=MMETSP0325_2-20121206/5602_1 /ASSEMBLY_ACC=CAM_ASM_000347 /TAXON_ID=2866 /ORGANISM="Crypthecodinium cohnii, Strain Seligo" /LENGTH=799 /DNA_ID=CAMNT_0054031355 /DNA_START=247 /DNA_END=2647 /DNA_ORIENTATION=+